MKEYLKIQMRIPKNEHLANYISNRYCWLINYNANLLFFRKEKKKHNKKNWIRSKSMVKLSINSLEIRINNMSQGSFGIIVVVIYAVFGYGVTNASGVAALMFGILSLASFGFIPFLYARLVEDPKRDEEEKYKLKKEIENLKKKNK